MTDRNDRTKRTTQRRPAEGVRIIGAEEAQQALDAGAAAGRRADDELRFGDVPPAPSGPRSPHRFPLPDSVDPAAAVPRPPVAPLRGESPVATPASRQVAGATPKAAAGEQGEGEDAPGGEPPSDEQAEGSGRGEGGEGADAGWEAQAPEATDDLAETGQMPAASPAAGLHWAPEARASLAADDEPSDEHDQERHPWERRWGPTPAASGRSAEPSEPSTSRPSPTSTSWNLGERSWDAPPPTASRPAPAAGAEPGPLDEPGPYDPAGYDPEPYDPAGYDPATYDPATYDPATYDPAAYDPAAYDPRAYDPEAYEPAAFEPAAPEAERQVRRGGPPGDPATYDPAPYDPSSYDPAGPAAPAAGAYDPAAPTTSQPAVGPSTGPGGYDPAGYEPSGYDPAGYDPATGEPAGDQAHPSPGPADFDPGIYDPAGYDPATYDPAGHDPAGYEPANHQPSEPAPAGATPPEAEPWPVTPGTQDEGVQDRLTVTGSHVLPHWTEPGGDVPSSLLDPSRAEADAENWGSGTGGARWRSEHEDWDDDVDQTGFLARDEAAVGALDQDRSERSDLYSFDEAFQQLEEERSGTHAAISVDDEAPAGTADETVAVGARPGSEGRTGVIRTGAAAAGRARAATAGRARAVSGRAPGGLPGARFGAATDGSPGSRIAVAGGLVVLLLIAYAIGPIALLVLATAAVVACAVEGYGLLQRFGFRPATLLGLAATAGVMLAAYWRGVPALPLVMALTFGATMLWYVLGIIDARPLANVAVTTMMVAWVGLLGSYAPVMLRVHDGKGLFLGVVVVVVAHDIVAYLVGRQWGRRPLAPSISPGKTVEGFAGGVVAALVIGLVIGRELSPWGGLVHGLALGIVVAVVAPIGDLFESLIKRDLGMKDSGSALPGHGGLLDRFDSVLLVLPAAYYLADYLHLVK